MARRSDLVLAIGVIGVLTVLVAPLPPMLLDFLLTTNLTLALLILFVAMYVRRPLEFSVFPSLLLVATLYRLSLNVAATRLILLHGGEGPGAAGRVIQGFGEFVVGGNFIVGVVLFLILVVIQFVVITKGAGRIAEVAARFTLDAMPGKQMAIDADLNAGLVAEGEARQRREAISREAEFYGAMDGASKFVRGDAIAAVIITAVNIVGGFAIGVLQEGMPLMDALATYTTLTVGDGLVAQLPALVTSTAAGIVVTRAASDSDLSKDLLDQLTTRGRPLTIAAGVLGVLALFPGLPMLPFLAPAAGLGLLAYRQSQKDATPAAAAAPSESAGPETVEAVQPVDPLQLEVGYGLLGLVEQGGKSGDVLDRIRLLRRQFASDLGFLVPPIRVRDSAGLGPTHYVIRVRGAEVARGEAFPDRLLAMNAADVDDGIEGFEVREPTFGLPARWIAAGNREAAQAAGYTVVDAGTVVATHLSETIRRHAASLLGRQDVQALVNKVRESHPAVVEGLIPTLLPLGTVHRVLQRLLGEGVSIRDLPVVLEVLGDLAASTREPGVLAEHARAAMPDVVCRPHVGADNTLHVLLLGPSIERTLAERLASLEGDEGGADLAPALVDAVLRALQSAPPSDAGRPILLSPAPLRRHLRRLTERALPQLVVLSYAELPPDVTVRAIATVEDARASQAV
ncbi:MAG TPA: flagellar biosynthesis protein FlhA [Terriglobales bacterium]|nr:flagellar biosynthesis protein FlhA [Terriglobales bacterium]